MKFKNVQWFRPIFQGKDLEARPLHSYSFLLCRERIPVCCWDADISRHSQEWFLVHTSLNTHHSDYGGTPSRLVLLDWISGPRLTPPTWQLLPAKETKVGDLHNVDIPCWWNCSRKWRAHCNCNGGCACAKGWCSRKWRAHCNCKGGCARAKGWYSRKWRAHCNCNGGCACAKGWRWFEGFVLRAALLAGGACGPSHSLL